MNTISFCKLNRNLPIKPPNPDHRTTGPQGAGGGGGRLLLYHGHHCGGGGRGGGGEGSGGGAVNACAYIPAYPLYLPRKWNQSEAWVMPSRMNPFLKLKLSPSSIFWRLIQMSLFYAEGRRHEQSGQGISQNRQTHKPICWYSYRTNSKPRGLQNLPGNPCLQIVPTLSPKVKQYDLHWAIWIPRVLSEAWTLQMLVRRRFSPPPFLGIWIERNSKPKSVRSSPCVGQLDGFRVLRLRVYGVQGLGFKASLLEVHHGPFDFQLRYADGKPTQYPGPETNWLVAKRRALSASSFEVTLRIQTCNPASCYILLPAEI